MQSLHHAPDLTDLIGRLGTITPERTRRWGRMTAHQMICHLGDSLRVTLGERSAGPNGNWLSHTLIKTICLRSSLPWPRSVKTSAELDSEQGGSRATEFQTDLDELIRLVERCAEHDCDHWPDHPFFGPMDRWSWGRFNYRHIRHHLQQFGAWS
jgi:hypothetical protein